MQVNLRAMPSFTLYGDGTVIVPGPVIQIYPGPAVTPLIRSKLSESQVQALLKRAGRRDCSSRGESTTATWARSASRTRPRRR